MYCMLSEQKLLFIFIDKFNDLYYKINDCNLHYHTVFINNLQFI